MGVLTKHSSGSNGFAFVVAFLWKICSNPAAMTTFPHILHAGAIIGSKYKKHYSIKQAMVFHVD